MVLVEIEFKSEVAESKSKGSFIHALDTECSPHCSQNSSQNRATTAESQFLCSSLVLGIETAAMEMTMIKSY